MRQITWRLIPFLMLAYFIAFVDRVNAGFAALHMNKDIGLSPEVFGFGGGLFYLTYVVFEIPSNLAMQKVGARIWIARIMISWGLVSAATAFIAGPTSFYAMRLLLGAAEAGFFPAVILYLTYWFPAAYRARIISLFMVAIPVSSLLGSPISAALLQTDGWLGMAGWRWLFVLEGIPAALLGVIAYLYLPSSPREVNWLGAAEKDWLNRALAEERESKGQAAKVPLATVLSNGYVWAAAFIYAGASGASQCLSLWQPQILKSFDLTDMETGWLNVIPFAIASVAMILWGLNSDKLRERTWHTAFPLALLAVSLAVAPLTNGVTALLILLCIAVAGTYMMKGPFWALTTQWLGSGMAAAGIALVNAVGNLGGLFGSWLLGRIKEATDSFTLGLMPLAILSAVGCILVLVLRRAQPAAAAFDHP
ncbi:MFS transporter [Methylovirgula sp. 4M-Z18]|nr:MFS transporter [Methylovirgula sp. 4M-Z18]